MARRNRLLQALDENFEVINSEKDIKEDKVYFVKLTSILYTNKKTIALYGLASFESHIGSLLPKTNVRNFQTFEDWFKEIKLFVPEGNKIRITKDAKVFLLSYFSPEKDS